MEAEKGHRGLLEAGNALDPPRSRKPILAHLIECCFHADFKASLIWLKDQSTVFFKKQKKAETRKRREGGEPWDSEWT